MPDDITWTCHICGAERPDALIALLRKPFEVAGVKGTQNIRFCVDRPGCREGAESYTFFDPGKMIDG